MTSHPVRSRRVASSSAEQDGKSVPSAVHAADDEATELSEQAAKNQAAIELLAEWKADDSGYDEETWPIIKGSVERNRLSSRPRFSE